MMCHRCGQQAFDPIAACGDTWCFCCLWLFMRAQLPPSQPASSAKYIWGDSYLRGGLPVLVLDDEFGIDEREPGCEV